jgi:SAM-dependent methyltransferase
MTRDTYLLEGRDPELDRLQLQSRVWEPAGRRLLDTLGPGDGGRVVDVGCGAMGWLRLLSEWVGPDGEVVGTDIDENMLNAAGRFAATEGLDKRHPRPGRPFRQRTRTVLVRPRARPVPHRAAGPRRGADGRAHARVVRPHGFVVLEELDPQSWHFVPNAPALGIDPARPVEAPLHFAAALDGLLRRLVEPDELDALLAQAKAELSDPQRWGLTFTITQCWGRRRS